MFNRIRYWLVSRRCTCRGYPKRFAGGTVELGGVKHGTTGPCYECDEYGRAKHHKPDALQGFVSNFNAAAAQAEPVTNPTIDPDFKDLGYVTE